MCVGYPALVLEVDATGATVLADGHPRRASTLVVPDVAPGDRVYVASGTILERLDEREAAEIEAALRAAFLPGPTESPEGSDRWTR